MDSSNFYVHLQSNSSPTYFPNNKITDFRNQLAATLGIDPSQYEVALAQCSYVYNPPYIKAGTYLGEVCIIHDAPKDGSPAKFINDQIYQKALYEAVNTRTFVTGGNGFFDYTRTRGSDTSDFFSADHELDLNNPRINEFTEECHVYNLREDIRGLVDLTKHINTLLNQYDMSLEINEETQQYYIRGMRNTFNVKFKASNVMCELYNIKHDGPVCKENYSVDADLVLPKGTELFTITMIAKQQTILPFKNSSTTSVVKGKVKNVRLLTKYFHEGSIYMFKVTYKLFSSRDCYKIDALTAEFSDILVGSEFQIENNLCRISLPEHIETLKLDDQISAMLGTSEADLLLPRKGRKIMIGKFRPFFGHGHQQMFIYADIVENQFIGGQVAPILRIADYKGEKEKTTTQEFSHHHYIALKSIPMSQIHMYIRSETGDNVPIELGSFSATLHFRRKQY